MFRLKKQTSKNVAETTCKLLQNCYIMNIGSPTHHVYPACKTIRTIWQNMKVRELQVSQFPGCLVNWEKFKSTV